MPALALALICAAALVALGDPRAHVAQVIALLMVWGLGGAGLHLVDLRRAAQGRALLDVRALAPSRVLLAALAVRAPLLLRPPGLSDDVYRYLWEGWLVLHGANPYASPPAAAWGALDHPVRALVNHPEVSTIYPPLMLWVFALLAAVGMTPLVVQVAMGLCDALVAGGLAAVLAGRGRSTAPAWLYAVLPLGAVEGAGNGHVEPLALLGLVLAIRAWDRGRSGLGWAGLGALAKLLPGVLLPLLARRQPWLLLGVAGVAGVAALPFLDAGPALLRGLSTYTAHWTFNATGFRVLAALLGPLGLDAPAQRGVGVALGAAACAYSLWAHRDPARVAMWAGAAFVVLSPTVHPWYLLWAWVPSLLRGATCWTVLALLGPLSYAALATLDPATGRWVEPTWPALVQGLALLACGGAEWAWHLTRPGPWLPRRTSTP